MDNTCTKDAGQVQYAPVTSKNTKGSRKKGGKSFTQRFSETKPMQTERWQSWLTTVIFFLTFVLSYERIKLKIREGLIILLTSSSC